MNKLPVPENIPMRWELWRGFGKAELARTGAVTLPVLGLCALRCAAGGTQLSAAVSVVLVMLVLLACVGFFGRMDQGQSIYEFLRRGRRFRREQQTFFYRRGEEVTAFVREEADE